MRVRLRWVAVLYVCAALIACGIPVFAAMKKPPPAAAPLITQAKAQAYVKQIAPLVEKVAGRKFKSIPRVKMSKGWTFIRIPALEMIPLWFTLCPHCSAEQIHAGVAEVSHRHATTFAAWYDPKAKCLMISPNALDRQLEWLAIPSQRSNDHLKLTLAHELAHALEDQNSYPAPAARKSERCDRLLAVDATAEGFATYVEIETANLLRLSKLESDICERISVVRSRSANPVARIIREVSCRLQNETYMGGRDFIAWHYRHGGIEEVWRILQHPPAASSMICHPETYSPELGKSIDIRPALKAAQACFNGYTEWGITDLGEIQLRSFYWDMDPSLRDRVTSGLECAQVLCGYGRNQGSLFVTVFVFKKSDIAPGLIAGLDDLLRKRLAADSSVAAVKDLSFGPFAGVQSDAGGKASFISQPGRWDFRNEFVRVACGRAMVEVFMQSMKNADGTIAKAIDAAFAKLPKDVTAGLIR